MVLLDTAIVRVLSVKILMHMPMTPLLATTGQPDLPDVQMQSKIIVMLCTPPYGWPFNRLTKQKCMLDTFKNCHQEQNLCPIYNQTFCGFIQNMKIINKLCTETFN
jgi:hypothetical protein